MAAPRIIQTNAHAHPGLPDLGGDAFEVRHAGEFGGRSWERGVVLFCSGSRADDALVVLTARGRGRPRLGRLDGPRIWGDAGEPCSAARWQVAGTVVAVARPAAGMPGGWLIEALEGASSQSPEQAHVGQLSLFAA